LTSISTNVGTADETAISLAFEVPGDYYILVFSDAGAVSEDPYTLQADLTPAGTLGKDACEWPDYVPGQTLEDPYPQLDFPPAVYDGSGAAAANTLILTHKGRIAGLHGVPAAESLMLKLNELADDPRVNGIVVPLDTDPTVDAEYDKWNDDFCYVFAANDVAEAISDLVQSYVNDPANDIQYVVIAGTDPVVPFFRSLDEVSISNESTYTTDALTNGDNPLYFALEGGNVTEEVVNEDGSISTVKKGGYISTDDIYTDDDPLFFRSRQLFVPDRASGRLVETPGDMIATIDDFLGLNGGVVDVQSCLVTSYDFLLDSGIAINDTLAGFGKSCSTLNNDGWDESALKLAWPDANPDLVSVNAHFEHWNSIPAGYAWPDGNLFYNTDLIDEVNDTVTNQIAYSMGCHGGLNVFDDFVIPNDPNASSPDFPQVFAQEGAAAWIANTGYGYGMDDAVTNSEQLYLYFTQELGEVPNATIGQAFVDAKQRYLSMTSASGFGIYDEKSMIEATLYGLPMTSVTGLYPEQPTSLQSAQAAAFTSQNVSVDLSETAGRTHETTSPDGSYYAINGEVQALPGQPIQPLTSQAITTPAGSRLAGVLLKSANFTDYSGFDPLIARPFSQVSEGEPDYSDPNNPADKYFLFPDGWFPNKLWSVNTQGNQDQLVVVGGQFNKDILRPRRQPGLLSAFNLLRGCTRVRD
jgi:hypothetical protein